MYTVKGKSRRTGVSTNVGSVINPRVDTTKNEKLVIRVSSAEKSYLRALAEMSNITVSKLIMDTMYNLQK